MKKKTKKQKEKELAKKIRESLQTPEAAKIFREIYEETLPMREAIKASRKIPDEVWRRKINL